MNRAARIGIIAISAVVFCYAGLGHVLGRTPDDRAYKSLTVYGEVVRRTPCGSAECPSIPLVTAGSLHGLLESLDPQSSYLKQLRGCARNSQLIVCLSQETGLTMSKRSGY